jgi:hypothetical protein
MKHISLLLASVLIFTNLAFSQFSDPNIDRIPDDFWDATTPTSVFAVVTDAQGFDNFNIGTDFAEPHLSMNPIDPLNCFVAYNTNGAHYVTNGLDWSASFSPSFGVSTNGDPVTAYDSLGNLYYENMVGGITGTRVIKSVNGGVSFGAGVAANTGNDKNWLAADQTNGPYKNYIYTVMTPGNFKRSTNGGTSFVQTFSAANGLPGNMVCVGANKNGATDISGGAVYFVISTGSAFAATYTFYCSNDGGATFSLKSSQNYAGYVGTDVAGRNSVQNMRTRPYPFIAADNSFGTYRGRLYLVYATNNPVGNGNKPNIYCRYSTNQGATFSGAILINDDASPDVADQFMPAIWCDKETGRLYCKWNDTRLDASDATMNVYASYSDNGGVTWAPNQKITTAAATINCTTCGGGGTPRYQGDYDAIASNSKTSMMAWTDMRAGTFGSYTAYYPDFGLLVTPSANTVHQTNSSVNFLIDIPAVKSYTDVTAFTATITPVPASGSIVAEFLSGNTLSTYPNTKYVKLKTVGTVTAGNYTVKIKGAGSNGTPVHERTVTLTVNSTVGSAPCEDFTGVKFPPANMYEEFSGTNFWTRASQSAYGIGSGSAKFDFYSAGPGLPINQSILTNNFTATGTNTFVTFDIAYAPYISLGPDTLVLETSSNFGATYTVLKTMLGKSDGTGELNTAPGQSTAYTPANKDWRSRIFALPAGTNKLKFTAKSGYGNNLYVDNICVQTLTVPVNNSIGIAAEGMWLPTSPYWSFPDTVKMYLHRSDFPNIIVDSATGTPNSSSVLNTLLFTKALNGSYYKVAKQRNTIETWSNVSLGYTRGLNAHFNFINPSGQAYGNNQALVTAPNRAMFSGDLDQDGTIDASDLSLSENSVSNSLSGYVVEDVTGDFFCDASDLAIVENNQGVNLIAPPGAEPQPEVYSYDQLPEFKNDAERIKYETGKKYLDELNERNKTNADIKNRQKEILNKEHSKNHRNREIDRSADNSKNMNKNENTAGNN